MRRGGLVVGHCDSLLFYCIQLGAALHVAILYWLYRRFSHLAIYHVN